MDQKKVIVNSKVYTLGGQSLKVIGNAVECFSQFIPEDNHTSFKELFLSMGEHKESLAKALSLFIQGDDKLGKELSKGSIEEIAEALETAVKDILPPFLKAESLAKNVAPLAAKPKM